MTILMAEGGFNTVLYSTVLLHYHLAECSDEALEILVYSKGTYFLLTIFVFSYLLSGQCRANVFKTGSSIQILS
jgi:hypothetical protein